MKKSFSFERHWLRNFMAVNVCQELPSTMKWDNEGDLDTPEQPNLLWWKKNKASLNCLSSTWKEKEFSYPWLCSSLGPLQLEEGPSPFAPILLKKFAEPEEGQIFLVLLHSSPFICFPFLALKFLYPFLYALSLSSWMALGSMCEVMTPSGPALD